MTVTASSTGIEDVYVLTPIQEGLLFEQTARPRDGVYIEQLLLTFRGPFDAEAFGAAWQAVVDRHPILRTSFHWRADGPPLQVVHSSAPVVVDVVDRRDVPGPEQDRLLREQLDRERIAGFDLTAAPLMRLSVIRVTDDRWVFAWRLSHLLMDGWSFGLAVTDFVSCFRALGSGRTPELAPMRPYRDYVAWWSRQDGADARAFWRAELDGFVPPEPLRLDGTEPVPGVPSHGFVETGLADLEPGLRELARANQLTLNTVVQGAWLLVLAQRYGTSDVVCGFTMAHRPSDLPGSETVLGPLIATMPVREKLVLTRSAVGWLRAFGVHLAAVREHAALPLYEVQRVTGLPRDVPLMESSVSYENMPMPDFALDEIGVEMVDMVYDGRPHYPITMVIMPGEGMPLRVIHDRSRISPAAAESFCAALRGVLERLVHSPESTVGELLPGPASIEPVAVHPGQAPVPAPAGTLPERFARHAAARPDHPAVRSGDRTLTYRELDERADAVARAVRDSGAPRVGLYLERSEAFVVAVLGVLKAGAAYVPLDPGLPAERVGWMLDDAGVELVLTTAALSGAVPAPVSGDRTVLDVHDLPDPSPARSGDAVPAPDSAAHVLYTSGSTGRPKAVVVTHRNVLSLLAAGRELFGFGPDDVWSALHSPSFDYSVWEMWGALGHGGTLVVVDHRTVRVPDELRRLIHTEGVTVCSQTPALFEVLATLDGDDGFAGVRHLFLGGDRLAAATVRGWIERHGDESPRLYNLYGVTEAAVVSTWYRIRAADVRDDEPVPIGWVLPNQRAYLLDEHERTAAPGARAELVLAGDAVAAGYLDRPELTARRFGTDPAGGPERAYRTGDLARLRADGALLHAGRDDGQVKIRGHRVELGEIEATLGAHDAVRTAVVTVRDGRIDAYAVPARDGVDAGDVLRFASTRLVAYMVPSTLRWIDELPVTTSGKVDLRALPAPAAASGDDPDDEPPADDLERAVVTLVETLLEHSPVGVRTPLAGLGVHSIHLIHLLATVRARWSADMAPEDLFVCATVREIAAAIERTRR